MQIMVNASVEIDSPALTEWEDQAARMSSDPAAGPALKKTLAEALEQDPVDAIKDAQALYQILLERAFAQPSSGWKWRRHPTWCWVCNSHNTQLIGAPGYGIVHDCLDCGDQFLLDGTIQWAANSQDLQPRRAESHKGNLSEGHSV
jgi:hypothetical protein